MAGIFIFTAGAPEARHHLALSITQQVPFDTMESTLGPERTASYRALLPEQSGFYAWGAVPGERNEPNWNAMAAGDLVLTVYGGRYRYVSTVLAKLRSPELANEIWGSTADGKTWEFMYLLSEPREVDLALDDPSVSPYLNLEYRGFTKIADYKLDRIATDFGSAQTFLEIVFGANGGGDIVERELRQARIEANAEPPFSPSNMEDGRKKVLREVVRRQGQPKFRRLLFEAYGGKCVVTGCDVDAVLEAAHISPYLGTESNSVQNGLLLRADIHTLFDLGLLKISVSGVIEVAEVLRDSPYGTYAGTSIRTPKRSTDVPSADALRAKYAGGMDVWGRHLESGAHWPRTDLG